MRAPPGLLTSLIILIIDDGSESAEQLVLATRKLGHCPISVHTDEQAIYEYTRANPDLVFLGAAESGKDITDLVQKLRQISVSKWVPFVFFADPNDTDTIISNLDAGCDDYMLAPIATAVFSAKLTGYVRMLSLQRQAHDNAEELLEWRQEAEEQAQLGAYVMDRLTDTAGLGDPMVRYINVPVDAFSGDLLCAARAPGEVLNVLLADATGHGLAAALTVIPITQVFYSMTAKGFPLPSIVEELNRKLKSILPADRFVAATIASVDVHNRTIEIWNGGNPDAVFFDSKGGVAARWKSVKPPLGILDPGLFSSTTETVVVSDAGDLLMCSDGLIEAGHAEGPWFGTKGVATAMSSAPTTDERFDALTKNVRAHLNGVPGLDDISALLVSVPSNQRKKVRFNVSPIAVAKSSFAEWRLDLSYGAQELGYIDVVPAVLGCVTQLHILQMHQGALFLVFSELFNNALDHGLLRLESSLKSAEGGFEIYLTQREERLKLLNTGRIDISFRLHQEEERVVLDMHITDTGPGFDFEECLDARSILALGASNTRAYGRGIAIVKNLCEKVQYSGNGNKVWVRFLVSEKVEPEPAILEDSAWGV